MPLERIMLKIAICDDEKIVLDSILKIVQAEFDRAHIKTQIQTFSDGLELLNKSRQDDFDMIFLDIELEGINGIDIAKKLRESAYDRLIIFITSFINYAVEGYGLNVFRFVLKSNMEMQLKECISSFIAMSNKKKIQVKSNELSINEIFYVASENHKIIIHLKNGKSISVYSTLNDFEESVQSKFLYRIHQSYLVNVNYVEDISRYELTLINDEKLPISKSRYQQSSKDIPLKRALWI